MGLRLRRCERFKKFIYDRENRTVCNRTKRNWLRIAYQYFLFLLLVIGIFVALFYFIMFLLDLTGQPAANKNDLVSSNKLTLNIVPLKINRELPEPVIWYTFSGEDSIRNRRASSYVDNIKEFFNENERACNKFPKVNCTFQVEDFGPCAIADYGYSSRKPCIFLKLNRFLDFEPIEYVAVPANYPEDLKKNIDKKRETVWVHCEGTTSYDDQHIGAIRYYPSQGFKDEYFPFKVRTDRPNLYPIMAIQLEQLQSDHFVALECKLFGRNLQKSSTAMTYLYVVSK